MVLVQSSWLAGGLAVLQLLLRHTTATPIPDTQVVLELQPSQPSQPSSQSRKLQGRFLHITDLHPDDFYKVHSSTEQGIACHRGKGAAGIYGAETTDCDSPFTLINATLKWIGDNLRDKVDFVIWTGDTARHDSDEQIPRTQTQVIGTNQKVADTLTDVFSDPNDPQKLLVPIIPTLGNNDVLPHNILLPGPNKWLQYYTKIWRRFIPEEQRHSFEFGGWFYVEVIPNKLAVFSINTLYLFSSNAGVDDCATPSEPGFKQMEWLHVQLDFLRKRGMKAILMGHVPPARTDSKQNWDETCWQKYTLWLQQYRDVITGSVYGHMNIDHFLVQDTKDIDIGLLTGETTDGLSIRDTLESELSVLSSADYLGELRQRWANIPSLASTLDEQDLEVTGGKKGRKGGKGRKGKKPKPPFKDIGGKWAERYQLSFVSPSVIPNYFPSIRVVEYNITGLESIPIWQDTRVQDFATGGSRTAGDDQDFDVEELKREVEAESLAAAAGKKKKPTKPKKPKDPNLVIPDPPASTAPPGPAYSPQPLTLTGYTQYYANLTYINNDMTHEEEEVEGNGVAARKWRQGVHWDKTPKNKKPKPHDFEFEVEYSTFNDTVYKLPDLTVKSLIQLAHRLAQKAPKSSAYVDGFQQNETAMGDTSGDEVYEAVEDMDDDESDFHEEKKGSKGKKHKKGKKHNKVWLTFLHRAFVSSVDKKELKKL